MEWVELFKIIIVKINLAHVRLGPTPNYDGLRQQLGLTIEAALSGPKAGQWIGGRTQKKKIYLFFKVSDPAKAITFIKRSLGNQELLGKARIRIKEKRIKRYNFAFV
jgi:hypothetical protein